MVLTFALVETWEDGKRVHVSGTIVASENYVTAGEWTTSKLGRALGHDRRPPPLDLWYAGFSIGNETTSERERGVPCDRRVYQEMPPKEQRRFPSE